MRSTTSAGAGRSSSSATARSAASNSTRDGPGAAGAAMTGLFESQAPRPLADRLRPQALDEVVGQDHLLAPEGPVVAGSPCTNLDKRSEEHTSEIQSLMSNSDAVFCLTKKT